MTKIQCIVDDFVMLKKEDGKYSDNQISECLNKFHADNIHVQGDELYVNGIFYYKHKGNK
jgi:hypothetical protein